MEYFVRKRAITIGVAAAIAVSAVMPSIAAPVSSNTAALKAAAASDVVNVRWWRGGAVAAGVATGLAVGALAGAAAGYPYYGGYPYYYGGPAYAAPAYGYGPGYYYGYYRPQQYDSAGVAVGPSYYCPPGAAMQNRC